MKELALYFLDIAQNSVTAGARHLSLTLTEEPDHLLTAVIRDDGCGMSPEFLAAVADPFTTTRTTRKVGMGLPLYRLAAEQTGGSMRIESTQGVGTSVTAVFHTDHLDCAPLGDMASTVALLIQSSPDMDLTYRHETPEGSFELRTEELRRILGPELSLAQPEITLWIRDYISEQEAHLKELNSIEEH